MPSQNEAMVDAFHLVIFERRQIGHRRGFGFVENAFGHGLQRAPARPFKIRSVRDLPQGAAPLDDHAINVTRADQIRDPTICSAPAPYFGGTPFSR